MGYVTVNHLENARRIPSTETAEAIADALGVAVDKVFPSNGVPTPNRVLRAYVNKRRESEA